MGIALALREGDTGYLDKWVVQVTYMLLLPSIMFAVSMVAESWVENLPSQVHHSTATWRVGPRIGRCRGLLDG